MWGTHRFVSLPPVMFLSYMMTSCCGILMVTIGASTENISQNQKGVVLSQDEFALAVHKRNAPSNKKLVLLTTIANNAEWALKKRCRLHV